jgi:hypothetical protein
VVEVWGAVVVVHERVRVRLQLQLRLLRVVHVTAAARIGRSMGSRRQRRSAWLRVVVRWHVLHVLLLQVLLLQLLQLQLRPLLRIVLRRERCQLLRHWERNAASQVVLLRPARVLISTTSTGIVVRIHDRR